MEVCLLNIEEDIYTLIKEESDVYGLHCPPHAIGDMALAFINTDLSFLNDLSGIKRDIDRCFDTGGPEYNSQRLQTILMGLKERLEDTEGRNGFFVVETYWLWEMDRALGAGCPLKQDLMAQLNEFMSQLESLGQFQRELQNILNKLSLADKKESAYASNIQILRRLFDDFPQLVKSCCGQTGYMIVDVDNDGKLRSEMLNLAFSNAMRAITSPEEPLLLRNNLSDNKVIGEYHVLSDIKMCIMYDLIEGLRHSRRFVQCATCKKFFFTMDKRQVYCENEKCRTDVARMRRRKERIEEDPFLREAFCYKNAMRSRYLRTCDKVYPDQVKKRVSDEEYVAWQELFRTNLACYKKEKAEAMLRDDSQEVIQKAGEAFLAKIRPEFYISKHKDFTE